MEEIKVKLVHPLAKMPHRGSASAAGYDLYAVSVEQHGNLVVYDTGIAVELPAGHVGLLFPRSSIYKTGLTLTNGVGVLDEDYRGTIKAVFSWNGVESLAVHGEKRTPYRVSERICQLVVLPYPKLVYTRCDFLSPTIRGEGGYGSTGND